MSDVPDLAQRLDPRHFPHMSGQIIAGDRPMDGLLSDRHVSPR